MKKKRHYKLLHRNTEITKMISKVSHTEPMRNKFIFKTNAI